MSGRRRDFPVSHLCCEMGQPRLVVRMVSSGLGAIKVPAEAVCAGRRAHSPSLEPLCLDLDADPTGPFGRAFVGEETHRLLVSGTLTHGGYLGCPLAGLSTQGERQRGLMAKEGSLRGSPPPQLTLQGPCLSLLVGSGARSCLSLWGPLPDCTGLRTPHGLYLGCIKVCVWEASRDVGSDPGPPTVSWAFLHRQVC